MCVPLRSGCVSDVLRLLWLYCPPGRHTEAFPRRRRRSPPRTCAAARTSGTTVPPCYVNPPHDPPTVTKAVRRHVGAGPVGLDGNILSMGAFGLPYDSGVLAILHNSRELVCEEACCVCKPPPVRGLLFGKSSGSPKINIQVFHMWSETSLRFRSIFNPFSCCQLN